MTEQTTSERLLTIAPTSPTDGGKSYTDIAMTGLFNAHVSTINSERQVIWQRYNIMLVANSIILGLLVRGGTGEPPLQIAAIGTVIVGLLLCILWWKLYSDGIDLFIRWNKTAARFSWSTVERERNPYVISETWRGDTKGRGIHLSAVATIWLFALGYAAMGVGALMALEEPIEKCWKLLEINSTTYKFNECTGETVKLEEPSSNKSNEKEVKGSNN